MTTVRRPRAVRWAAAAAGVALLCGTPVALAARPVEDPRPEATAEELVRLARASGAVAHSGHVEIRARLGLPELPQLGDVSRLLQGTTRARVWWESPERWRVSDLALAGESNLTRVPQGIATRNYQDRSAAIVLGEPDVRLPRVDDLLPPQAARRILGVAGPDDRIERIAPRRVAGIEAAGIRVMPGDPRSRISDVSLWVHPGTGLPLQVEVRDRARADPVLISRFLDADFAAPSRHVTEPVFPTGRPRPVRPSDLAATVDREGPWRLPDRLAGLPRAADGAGANPRTGGVGTYGTGLTRLVLLPLPPDVAGDALRRSRTVAIALELPGGEATLVERPLLGVVIARADSGSLVDRSYLLAGTASTDLLRDAVRQLFTDPPPPRVTAP